VQQAVERIRQLPPLVTSFEIERLRELLSEAERGERLVLVGGDCAETFADCRPDVISRKLKILLQMSLVLLHGAEKPVVRIGRLAGQYAKPRSRPVERRAPATGQDPIELPSYFGDLVNRADFTPEGREPNPALMVQAYQHAAMTLNFVRSLVVAGFADVHHPEYWDLAFLERADLPDELRADYQRTSRELLDALRLLRVMGVDSAQELGRVEFFTSHEGLNLEYEAAQTRTVPRRGDAHYDLTTHLPWIGERTRALDGPHVEFFRGVRNPIGVKLGPTATPDDLVALAERLDPDDEPGRLVLITRVGAGRAGQVLPPLIDGLRAAGRHAVWVCDPMHGNTRTTQEGRKTRSFDAILRETEETMAAHAGAGSIFGGVHFELTGEDVTECTGGADGLTEADLAANYATACDPRLNYRQSLEMAFRVARGLARARAAGTGSGPA
jgi:3-deoxy-7-phosphoheptulonate synthase